MKLESLERVEACLRRMPGLGYRSAERIALHLLIEQPDRREQLITALQEAAQRLRCCPVTGNLTEGDCCPIYANPGRDRQTVCVVEHVPDLIAMERSGEFKGTYHVLGGKLSPLRNIGPESLRMEELARRVRSDAVREIVLALSNDIEGEATSHYIRETIVGLVESIRLTRLGVGLPSGSGVTYADAATIRSALETRREIG